MKKALVIALAAVIALVGVAFAEDPYEEKVLTFRQEGEAPWASIRPFGCFTYFDAGESVTYSALAGLTFGTGFVDATIQAEAQNIFDPLLLGIDLKLETKFELGLTINFYADLSTTWDLRVPGAQTFVADVLEVGGAATLGKWIGVEASMAVEVVDSWLFIPWLEVKAYFGDVPEE